MKKSIFILSLFVVAGTARAADPAATTLATNPTGQFEVVDVSGQVVGDPELSMDAARTSWNKACQEWKTETKDLNKKNEVLGMSCNNPGCVTVDVVKSQCTSTGTYKVKTAGVRVNDSSLAPPLPEPPVAAQLPPQHEISTPPPPAVVEVVPAPRVGFIWISGYWGWEGRRHVWIPGRWTNERPGYSWNHEHWSHQGNGWHFEGGHWELRH